MIMKRTLKTLAVIAVLLSVAVLPALAETKNGPLVFANYYDYGSGPLHTYDSAARRLGQIEVNGRYPDVTPDGKTVVYGDGNSIYSVPINGRSAATQLTPTDTNHAYSVKDHPTVSPDGKTVYFHYFANDEEGNVQVNGIYSVPIEGGDITQVIADNKYHYGLEITPDGQNFVYGDGVASIFVQPVSGGPATPLYDGCLHNYCDPAVSPDGTKIAFMNNSGPPFGSEYSVFTMPLSTSGGGTPTKVSGSEMDGYFDFADLTVAYSPDGRYIAYNFIRSDNNHLGECEPFAFYCGYAETRWIPVEGGNYNYIGWGFPRVNIDYYAPVQVVWAPAVSSDTTGPTSTATSSPRPNTNGWNNSDVTVALSATDNDGGSGVEKITYSASGAQTIAQTDVSGSSVDVKLDQEGTTTLTFFATDEAGNEEAPHTLTVKIDKTPPSVSSTNPSSNATGVSATANIEAIFSEVGSGIDPRTVTPGAFKVVQVKPTGNVSVPGVVSYNEGAKKATFDPSGSLAKGLYKASITNGVKDKAGNALSREYTWLFATAGPSK